METDADSHDRDTAEAAFFRKGIWRDVDQSMVGIETLRQRLCTLQFARMRDTVPLLKETLSENMVGIKLRLEDLGQARADVKAQRSFLLHVAKQFETVATDAIKRRLRCRVLRFKRSF